jgi:hypothetical protein
MTPTDTGIVYAATVGVGLAIVIVKIIIRSMKKPKAFEATKCTADLLNGSMVVPFSLMTLGVFSTTLSEYLRNVSPEYTALAGGVGLFFLIGSYANSDRAATLKKKLRRGMMHPLRDRNSVAT